MGSQEEAVTSGAGEQRSGKGCCGSEQGLAALLTDEAWTQAVRRMASESREVRQKLVSQVLALIGAGLEREVARQDRPPPPLSPYALQSTDLVRLLFDSMVVREPPGSRTGEKGPRRGPLRAEGTTPVKTDGDSFERTLCELVGGECVDLWSACADVHDGTCLPVPALVAEYLTGEECICVKKPGWRDLALVALIALLLVTPMPDEVLVGPAVLARLLQLIVRVRPVAAIA